MLNLTRMGLRLVPKPCAEPVEASVLEQAMKGRCQRQRNFSGENVRRNFSMKANSKNIVDCREEKWLNDETVFDKNEALEINGDEEEFLKELAEMFIDGLPEQISLVKKAVDSRDSNALEKSAHNLKGAVANFGKNTVFKAALSLEMMGRENRWDDVEETYGALARETGRLVYALREFVKSK